jgi:hypothetical protein
VVRVLARLLLLTLTLLLAAGRVQAADEPLSLDAYWQLVEETYALVLDLQANPAEPAQPALAAMAERWQTVTAVALPDGTITPLDHSFLVAQLQAESPDLGRLGNYLALLRATKAVWPSAKHTAADTDSLRAILARPEFQWQEQQPNPIIQFLNRLLRRILEFFAGDGSGDGAAGAGSGSLIDLPFTIVGAVILLVILFFTTRGLLAELVTEAELEAAAESGDEALTAQAALKRAQRLSGEGDYRTAVRYLYLSSLLLLEERGLLRYDRSLTNREYLRSLAHRPELATTLRDVIDVFDRVWYGFEPLDAAEYHHYEEQVNNLRHQKADRPAEAG